ncbi:DNA helicase PcrA [Lacticaseibacillus songhuajiangensis]|jgi:DNA helicase-2/ATP-dependent DNA helicase PcrA|uniref:DNA helicase PcrA n=1 Tax=Lacticaseibacillus songhuajiangensis TaxID=1296539 RepID=UPI000F76D068|nr:DNA helicase PcrA [Lacticaseibacillus songhuajiangensis]
MGEQVLLKGMNDKQSEAVLATEGPVLIMAGAGSGKTRVLTHRVAYLIEEKNVNPWNVLAITFTNKAAREMKERVGNLLDPELARDVWVSTFHALCMRILRRDIEKLGYNRAFSITDTSAQLTLVKQVLRSQNLDPKRFDPKAILSAISAAKNELLNPDDYAKSAKGPFEEVVAQVYKEYQRRLRADSALDFDDLIMQTIVLFKQEPETLAYYQRKFRYIHVDEYQDTNEAQYQLVAMLAEGYRNLCVVGDADQSIYGWRGANMKNILNFKNDYKDAQVILLEQNYRSTQTILDAANAVIKNNAERQVKTLWTENGKGDKIGYYRAQSDRDEAYFVIRQIEKMMREQNYHYGDFAILYRTNAQSRSIEEAFLKSSIPYKIVGGHKFYDRKEIRDALGYLSLAVNPADNISFQRVVNEPKRGIGASTIEKLSDFADEHGWSLLDAAENVELSNISARARTKLADFAQMMTKLRTKKVGGASVTDLMTAVLEDTGYIDALRAEHNLEADARIDNLQELLTVTQNFDSRYEPDDEEADIFVDFLGELALLSDADDAPEEPQEVTLMTLHAAKGLEFPIVFLVGMEENLFPLSRAAMDETQLEEERRLAYVGITRAKKKLFLTNAYSRLFHGQHQNNPASRFVEEIPDELLDSQNAEQQRSDIPFINSRKYGRGNDGQSSYAGGRSSSTYGKPSAPQRRSANHAAAATTASVTGPTVSDAAKVSWQAGDKAEHRKWGVGTVVKVDGAGEDQELDVAFPNMGIKRLLAAFAPLKKVE